MADIKQPTKALQGVYTPDISGLDKLTFTNGMNLRAVADATVSPAYGEYVFSIAQGPSINGLFFLRFTFPTGNITATISCSARAVNGVGETNQINLISVHHENASVNELTTLEIRENSTASDIALIVHVKTSVSTSATVNVAAAGDLTPQINVNPLVVWTISGQYQQIDSRTVQTSNLTAQTNVDLNAIRTPGAISCDPAIPSTSPTNDGYGVVLTFGSTKTGILSQFFVAPNGYAYTRTSDASRSWPNPWRAVLNDINKQEILDQAATTSIVWSIVMS